MGLSDRTQLRFKYSILAKALVKVNTDAPLYSLEICRTDPRGFGKNTAREFRDLDKRYRVGKPTIGLATRLAQDCAVLILNGRHVINSDRILDGPIDIESFVGLYEDGCSFSKISPCYQSLDGHGKRVGFAVCTDLNFTLDEAKAIRAYYKLLRTNY